MTSKAEESEELKLMSGLIFDIAQFVKKSLEYKLLMSALLHSCQKEPTKK